MRIFGKSLSDYVRFQWLGLVAIAVVALLRLALSLAGVPNTSVRWLSATAVVFICTLVYSARVHTAGFGGYKQVLPLVWLQSVTLNVIVIGAIVLAMGTGQDNIFTAPEFSGGGEGKVWGHVLGHVVFGLVIAPLILWGLGSLALLVARKLAPRPGATRAAA